MPSLRRALAPALLLGTCVLPIRLPAQAPSFRDVSGHAFGEQITRHFQMQAYLERLAATSDRVTLIRQGQSWEGRALLLAVVTAPENRSRLEEIRQNSLRLADPRRTTPADAATIISNQPVIAWYGGSIHGFELSGSEGVLKLLEHLTTRNDPATLEVLGRVVVLIDPMLNPDGRDAFAHLNFMTNGQVANPAPMDWSNDFTGWESLKFRTGHYYFDTNRDWFAHTQRETRDRMPTLHAWRPQIATDMHEMGADAEFYFDPPGDPSNPHMPRFTFRWFKTFGEAYAAAFDSAGFEYMTRERYNYFYPGYTSNRGYQGAVAMLFEQGSSRGLALERAEGPVRTLAQALEQQYVAAWTGVRTAAANREVLLREYYESQRGAVDPAEGTRRYYLVNDGSGNLRELVRLLRRNDIEVRVTTGETRLTGARDRNGAAASSRSFPTGTLVVETGQPAGRLARALLEPHVPMDSGFLAAARRYVERDENPRFYDITGWSLPLLFDVQAFSSDAAASPSARALNDSTDLAPAPVPSAAGGYAYVLPGHQPAAVAALYHLKARGHRAAIMTKATRVGNLSVPNGSVIVRIGQNDSSVHRSIRELAARYQLDVSLARTGLSDSALPALGSGDWSFNAKAPSIALLAEDPIQGYSFGWLWYTLDRQYQIPTTVLRTRSIAGTPLHRFNVLVIPSVTSAALASALGRGGVDRIRRWVQDGGTLVTIGGATDFARDTSALGLIALRSWYESDSGRRATRYNVPGAVFRTTLDPDYWLRAGYQGDELPMLVGSDRLYLPPDGPPSAGRRVVARYAAGNPLSGHAWDESRERLPGKVAVYEQRVGQGRVIAFAEDPNFRAYARGMNRMFLNAVVLGPSAP